MVDLVLKGLRHQALAAEFHRIAVEIDAPHPRERVAVAREVEAGHRQAPLFDEVGLPRHLDELGVDHIAHLPVDVVAERAKGHTDLVGGEAGTARQSYGLEEVIHEGNCTGIPGPNRIADRPQHGVAEQSDGSFCHRVRRPGARAGRRRPARRVPAPPPGSAVGARRSGSSSPWRGRGRTERARSRVPANGSGPRSPPA